MTRTESEASLSSHVLNVREKAPRRVHGPFLSALLVGTPATSAQICGFAAVTPSPQGTCVGLGVVEAPWGAEVAALLPSSEPL